MVHKNDSRSTGDGVHQKYIDDCVFNPQCAWCEDCENWFRSVPKRVAAHPCTVLYSSGILPFPEISPKMAHIAIRDRYFARAVQTRSVPETRANTGRGPAWLSTIVQHTIFKISRVKCLLLLCSIIKLIIKYKPHAKQNCKVVESIQPNKIKQTRLNSDFGWISTCFCAGIQFEYRSGHVATCLEVFWERKAVHRVGSIGPRVPATSIWSW